MKLISLDLLPDTARVEKQSGLSMKRSNSADVLSRWATSSATASYPVAIAARHVQNKSRNLTGPFVVADVITGTSKAMLAPKGTLLDTRTATQDAHFTYRNPLPNDGRPVINGSVGVIFGAFGGGLLELLRKERRWRRDHDTAHRRRLVEEVDAAELAEGAEVRVGHHERPSSVADRRREGLRGGDHEHRSRGNAAPILRHLQALPTRPRQPPPP